MRGKLGDKYSIFGDWLYDWAKLYQSLIGYDEILQNINIEKEYKNEMINHFKNFFINRYNKKSFKNLKIITKSLLFSLLPLHINNNDKFYNLIFDINLN
jgi:hypothetical protein